MRELIMRFRGNAVMDMLAGAAAKSILLIVVFAVFHAATLDVSADYVTEVTSDSPIMWYRLNEDFAPWNGETASDSGTWGRDASYATDNVGNVSESMDTDVAPAKDFGAAGAGVSIPSLASPAGLSAFSVEFMMKPDVGAYSRDFNTVLAVGPGWTDTTAHLNISAGNLELAVKDFEWGTLPLSELAPEGQWSHVVVTYDVGDATVGMTETYYINGIAEGTYAMTPLDQWATDRVPDFAQASQIGYNATYGREFYGALDEVSVYDKVLSGNDVKRHYLAIPEPASLAMMFGALCVFAMRRRRRGITT